MTVQVEPLRKPVRIVTPDGIKKRCALCREYKPLSEFRYRRTVERHISYCYPCERKYHQEYRVKNKARISAYQSKKAAERWVAIKADPERHAKYLEDIRIQRRLQNKDTKMRRGEFYQKETQRYLDPEPLIKFVRNVLLRMTVEDLAKLCKFDHNNIHELLNNSKRVSFYKADKICTAVGTSVYSLYPEALDD